VPVAPAVLTQVRFSFAENGVYTSLAASVALLLFRVAVPGGSFLGRVRVGVDAKAEDGSASEVRSVREIYVPFNARGSDSKVKVEPLPAGVLAYRFSESFLFPNASHYSDALTDYVKAHTRRGKPESATKLGDRPWNRPGPIWWLKKNRQAAASDEPEAVDTRPRLRSIVLDFAAVANLDTTGVQNLVDVRREVELYADGEVTFHFACVN
jgi:sodium-independent sulfate anion transporter 11